MSALYPSSVEAISNLLFIDESDAKADVCVVLGGRHYAEAMRAAKRLFDEGKANTFLLTGRKGHTQESAETCESELAFHEGVRLGMPEEVFLLEKKSTNTKENILFAHQIIERELSYEAVRSILFVCQTFHTRRVLMTAKQVMPAHLQYHFVPVVDERRIRKTNWWTHEPARTRTLQELARIAEYSLKGDLALG